jgi:hypothetical protein
MRQARWQQQEVQPQETVFSCIGPFCCASQQVCDGMARVVTQIFQAAASWRRFTCQRTGRRRHRGILIIMQLTPLFLLLSLKQFFLSKQIISRHGSSSLLKMSDALPSLARSVLLSLRAIVYLTES